MRAWLKAFVPAICCLVGAPALAAPPSRVALVIGDGGYKYVPQLGNARNDARLIAQTLAKDGFTLVGGGPQFDLDKVHFDQMVQAFGRAIEGADVAMFYYAGHGLQIGGNNYLVPVDANPTREADTDFELVDAAYILHQMRDARTRLNILILDACRNNPFSGRGLRDVSSGLAQMQAPTGTFISYSTQPGNVAQDGTDGDSPYAEALASAMRTPGLDLFQVFNQTGLRVAATTHDAQQPWMSNSPIQGEFFFVPAGSRVTIETPGRPIDAETAFWQSIQSSTDVRAFQAYLQQYPSGNFVSLAKLRIAALQGSGTPPPAELATGRYAGRILTAEPPDYAMASGERALVDDKACPAGQLKEVVGGSKHGAKRQRWCVTMPVSKD